MIKMIASISGILGAAVFVVASIWSGLYVGHYDPVSQFISEGYARGMPYASILQLGFIVSGVLLSVFGWALVFHFRNVKTIQYLFIVFTVFYGFGTVVTGIFPCDMGCVPDEHNPSVSQYIHNLSGGITYLTIPLTLLLMARSFKRRGYHPPLYRYTRICGLVSIAFVTILFLQPESHFKGLYQRIIEIAILSWILVMSTFLQSGRVD
ncbi:DUF998 domain-containing protein [Euzebyella marina]|uniref:DUF998 domain-containing protein n=2 Tax=Euzebyella marina TaxID=1761453 RepID=A0A3G2L2L4_9FLAO|nr:DUF998 domain-containing protein [Euzebyella marina]